jgi:tetratricopeptide (TPR) repeat protein
MDLTTGSTNGGAVGVMSGGNGNNKESGTSKTELSSPSPSLSNGNSNAIGTSSNGNNGSGNNVGGGGGGTASSATAAVFQKLSQTTEACWFQLGNVWEMCGELDRALVSYEGAVRQNPYHPKALTQMGTLFRIKEMYPKAIEYFQRVLQVDATNGDVWGALGHCFLMIEDLQKAYAAYQKALLYLQSPKDPNLWYGIGILYDRYGSFDHAEEAFNAVLRMDSHFEKRSEVLFRLGLIYKNQGKLDKSLDAYKSILGSPPRPLVPADIYFQIGHVHELKKEFAEAKNAYEQVLKENPGHAKVLQQLGWLYHHHTDAEVGLGNQEIAISYLMRSIDADATDGQTWYLLGRCYMSQQKYRKAYDAYQQAVYRDGNNPTFWRSIGVLYYQIAQFRDALDAYTKAIRLNPYISDVWADLGTLYEACGQRTDALDAFQRAAELDPNNKTFSHRLAHLQSSPPTILPSVPNGSSILNKPTSSEVASADGLDSLATLAGSLTTSPPLENIASSAALLLQTSSAEDPAEAHNKLKRKRDEVTAPAEQFKRVKLE